jgi:hypothetical protein
MPDHEPTNISQEDAESGEKHELRAARAPAVGPRGLDTPGAGTDEHVKPVPSDAVEAASEPMVLERLPEGAAPPPPPGRQRTGDPPAV